MLGRLNEDVLKPAWDRDGCTAAYRPSCLPGSSAWTGGRSLIGPAWVTCPGANQSGEPWVARRASHAAWGCGHGQAFLSPRNWATPVRMRCREVTACALTARGIGATQKGKESSHHHGLQALPTGGSEMPPPIRWGLSLPPSSR